MSAHTHVLIPRQQYDKMVSLIDMVASGNTDIDRLEEIASELDCSATQVTPPNF